MFLVNYRNKGGQLSRNIVTGRFFQHTLFSSFPQIFRYVLTTACLHPQTSGVILSGYMYI